jgi:hypothetical protein
MSRLDRIATLDISLPLTHVVGPNEGTRLPILMYHTISGNLFGISHPSRSESPNGKTSALSKSESTND